MARYSSVASFGRNLSVKKSIVRSRVYREPSK